MPNYVQYFGSKIVEGVAESWVELGGGRWRWVHRLVIPNYLCKMPLIWDIWKGLECTSEASCNGTMFISISSEVFHRIAALKHFELFPGKHPQWNPISVRMQIYFLVKSPKACEYIKKRLNYWRFPEEFYKIFKETYLGPYQASMVELFCDV